MNQSTTWQRQNSFLTIAMIGLMKLRVRWWVVVGLLIFLWWSLPLCLFKSYLWPHRPQWQTVKTKTSPGLGERGANETLPSVWLILSSPWLLFPHWSTTAEIHLSGSPPMGAQCRAGERRRPMGGPDPPGLPPVCLSGSWLSSHLTVSRCQHYWNIFNQKPKYFSN